MIAELERVAGRAVSHETFHKLEAYVARLREENERQNLVSAATLGTLWERHILDSAQLVRFELQPGASWVDIGSGAGLPGIVISCLVEGPVTLVEPRRLRADFLRETVAALGLDATVFCGKAKAAAGTYDVITARAVARLDRLLALSAHLSTGKTRYVLPKGRGGVSELAEAKRTWQGRFTVERSVTDDQSVIIVGTGVEARAKR